MQLPGASAPAETANRERQENNTLPYGSVLPLSEPNANGPRITGRPRIKSEADNLPPVISLIRI